MTTDSSAAARVVGQWFHSHEEDGPGGSVYRPVSFDFPRARMPRESIVLAADGSAGLGRPGPADRAALSPARWSMVGDQVVIDTDDGRILRLTVDEQAPALVVRPTPQEGPEHDHHAGG